MYFSSSSVSKLVRREGGARSSAAPRALSYCFTTARNTAVLPRAYSSALLVARGGRPRTAAAASCVARPCAACATLPHCAQPDYGNRTLIFSRIGALRTGMCLPPQAQSEHAHVPAGRSERVSHRRLAYVTEHCVLVVTRGGVLHCLGNAGRVRVGAKYPPAYSLLCFREREPALQSPCSVEYARRVRNSPRRAHLPNSRIAAEARAHCGRL